MYKSYTSFVNFTPKYFIIFDAIVNGIVFLILFLNCSLLIYRNKITFLYQTCKLTLLLLILVNFLIVIDFFRIFYIENQVMCIKTVLLFPSNLDFFNFCFCLITLA